MKAKEALKKTEQAAMKLVRLRFKKYIVVLALGVLIVGFLGDNSVVAHLRNKSRIGELKAEVAANTAVTKANQERLRQMQTDPKAVERVGRERYFMKHDDEDVFVLSGDAAVTDYYTVDDETVE